MSSFIHLAYTISGFRIDKKETEKPLLISENQNKVCFEHVDNVKIKFTKMDRLIFTNLDRII